MSQGAPRRPSLRPLLPANPGRADDPPPPTDTASKANTTAACNTCRRRKVKCDGRRPACGTCSGKRIHCQYPGDASETRAQAIQRKYNEMQEKGPVYQRIYELLKSMPRVDAEQILNRIRAGAEPEAILRSVDEGDLLLQMSLMPETYEFPYSREIPPQLHGPRNPYLASRVYEALLVATSTSRGNNSKGKGRADDSDMPSAGPRVASTGQESRYLNPYHAAEIVDERLNAAKPSQWTSILSDDTLMRKLLQNYFMIEHQWHTSFHKDYFLEDMIEGRHRFCSPLLVHAVLALASHSHRGFLSRAQYWNPKDPGYRFFAEAKRLWELEREKSRLTTIQAGMVLTAVYDLSGADKIGWECTSRAIEMAHDLELFSPMVKIADEKLSKAREFTAWCLYTWQSLQCYHLFRQPLLKEHPKTPLPDPAEDPDWYGEIWVKYPLDQSRTPSFFGFVFKAKAEYWAIITELASKCFADGNVQSQLSYNDVEMFYTRLLMWHDTLPTPLQPKHIFHPAQLKLHMHYYNATINLFNLWIPSESQDAKETVLAEKLGQNPSVIIMEAKKMFETLLRLYHLRHGFSMFDHFLAHNFKWMAFLCNEEIKERPGSPDADRLRSTLFLCAVGMHHQGQNSYLAQTLLRLVRDDMGQVDADEIKKILQIDNDKEEAQIRFHEIHSEWPVNITSITSIEKQRLSNLCQNYINPTSESEGF